MLTYQERVLMVVAEPKRTVREAVDRKVKANECLLCSAAVVKRGLCQLHYSQWYNRQRGMTKRQRAEYLAESIREGKVLDSRQGQRVGQVNPFDEIAERVRRGA